MQKLEKEIYTVSQLTYAIKNELESKFPSISIKGEVSNLRKQASGHIYFTLKDAKSQISVALFHGVAKGISKLPKDGDEVCVTGDLSVYPPRGSYQIIARSIQLSGLGDLLIQLHKLKESLKQKGWFDPAVKQTLPIIPKTIGVITSPTGAVIQDILHILSRRSGNFHLILCPVKVQGPGSAEEIAEAIDLFNDQKMADVLIVGRGGGSLEDLWPFNEELVARAIFQSKIPLISAVGHETDFTIADLVADVRAPTPSAAAEIVMGERSQILKNLESISKRMTSQLQHLVHRNRLHLERITSHPRLSDPLYLIGPHTQKLDDITYSLTTACKSKLDHWKLDLVNKRELLQSISPLRRIRDQRKIFKGFQERIRAVKSIVERKRGQLKHIEEHLSALNPSNVLKKGYCIPFLENNDSVIISASDLKLSQVVALKFHDGDATAIIKNIN